MNIREAKEEIRKTVEIYLDKENGRYSIPNMKQRPVFMTGAPGIGKTAIVEQVAREMSLGFVSYSMTHHTRQSAIGLPYIEERDYGEGKVRISEYTLSEIVASVFDEKDRGHKEGILFLDEINCVSETLFPALLQFLQYKSFGNHSLPEGWVIVAAGNPPRYNRFVREFDIAVLDRLKTIKVEESLEAWKPYAAETGIHGAILTFLELEPDCFYRISTDEEGPRFVTARGWEDLSLSLKLYEKKGFAVDEVLLSQYLADPEIAGKFGIFYRLYGECREKYPLSLILSGGLAEAVINNAKAAPFDERLAVLELITDALSSEISGERLESAFRFIEDAWGTGQEMSFFMTRLTLGKETALFIAKNGSPSYVKYSDTLMLHERREALKKEISGSRAGFEKAR